MLPECPWVQPSASFSTVQVQHLMFAHIIKEYIALNMRSLKCYATIVLCVILRTRGDRWYSATILDKHEDQDIQNSFNTGQRLIPPAEQGHKNNDEGFEPRETVQDHTLPRWEMLTLNPNSKQTRSPALYGSSNLQITNEYYEPVENVSRKPVEVINYNNTINVVNVIKRTRPKRKVVKRCPNVPSRQNKKLVGNQTARTKFLEVFEVVEFEHVICISSSGLEGTCIHEYECAAKGGSSMGTCANGYGTCCVSK